MYNSLRGSTVCSAVCISFIPFHCARYNASIRAAAEACVREGQQQRSCAALRGNMTIRCIERAYASQNYSSRILFVCVFDVITRAFVAHNEGHLSLRPFTHKSSHGLAHIRITPLRPSVIVFFSSDKLRPGNKKTWTCPWSYRLRIAEMVSVAL